MSLGNYKNQQGAEYIMASMAELEQHYYEMTELYDLAEALVETVESEFIDNPEQQLAIVEPLIDEIGESTDILTEEFMKIVEGKKPRKSNPKMEGALRRIYTAIDAYHKRVDASLQGAKTGFRNIADPIVKKIVRQMEAVVAALIDFVELSLDRIMHHSYAEELRKRQEKIAMMLHNLGHGQGAS